MTENVNNYEIYLVGGAVRDQILGLEPVERDWVVVGSSTDQMLELGFKMVGNDFPVFLHPRTNEEYALARTERKSAPGHKGFEIQSSPTISLEDDLKRRDLTVNAMALSSTGKIIDPFGGQHDIEQRILRHVSPAFCEDPLRVLRVARFMSQFAQFEFSIADQTLQLMTRLSASGELSTLAAERIWTETEKALLTSKPSLYFLTLHQCGALKILFPGVDALFGIPQRAKYHPEIDTGLHTMMVLDRAAELTCDIGVRFAALTHDLGKALTPLSQLPRHIGHEKRGLKPLAELFAHYPIPKKIKRIARPCCEYHLLMHVFDQLRPETILKLIENLDGFRRPHHIEQFILLCQADSQGRSGMKNKAYPQANIFRTIFHAVRETGASDLNDGDLSGPKIGEALRKLRIQKIRDYLNSDTYQHALAQHNDLLAGKKDTGDSDP